ncbi:MAG: hypothetical protein ACM3JJ_13680 [Hyphomicrobiales bacterium]
MSARRAAIALAAALGLTAATGAAPRADAAGTATRLFIRNHVNSNDVRGLAAWGGTLAAATGGGIVTVAMPGGPAAKVLSAPGGLPSNQTLCAVAGPSGALWIGTGGDGLARLKPDGSFRRTLTTFDGLPTDRVQALARSGDSVWVGTSGGVALFAEDAATGQVSLRRSDSNASTAGALISDDIRAIATLGDTVWCATDLGLAAFAAGAWIDRRDVYAGVVNGLATAGDTLWVGAAAGPRAYVDGSLEPPAGGFAGTCLALGRAGGAIYAATNGAGVFRFDGAAWVLAGGAAPGFTTCLAAAPDGALWAGTTQGIARLDPAAQTWSLLVTEGPVVDDFQRVAVDGAGAWFATGNTIPVGVGGGLVIRYDGSSWSALTNAGTGGALQAASTFAVFVDRARDVWLGHCCGGTPPEPRAERYDPAAGTWIAPGGTNVWSFAEAPDGKVYGASADPGIGVTIYDGTTGALIDSLTPQNTQGAAQGAGLTSNDLRDVAFDPLGRAWIALASNGLERWDGKGTADRSDDVWTHFAGGFPSLQTTSVAVLDASTAVVGTKSGAVVLTNGLADAGRTGAINALLGGAAVNGVTADPRRVVWLATDVGLVRFDETSAAAERFTVADGLVDDQVRSVAWDEAHRILWAATAHGVSEIHAAPEGAPSFGSDAYVYPNPVGPGAGPLRVGGLTGSVTGEIRDLTGRRVRNFHADPLDDAIWDLNGPDGSPAAPGVYLVVLREGGRSRLLRVAVIR